MDNKYFYGIRGIRFIWHGEWADPELIWREKSFNYYDLEMPLWEAYKEECFMENKTANEDCFPAWVKENADLVRDLLQQLLENGDFYGV